MALTPDTRMMEVEAVVAVVVAAAAAVEGEVKEGEREGMAAVTMVTRETRRRTGKETMTTVGTKL